MAKVLKLFTNKACPFCQRVEIVAREKHMAFERVEVPLGETMPAWYKEINPREVVPTLQVDGKQFVYESDLISRYVDDISSPSSNLMGYTPYERHRVEFFMTQIGDLVSAWYACIKDPFNPERRKAVADNTKYIEDIIGEQQKSGGPYFFDDTFSMADVMVIPFLIRFQGVMGYYCAYDIFSDAPRLKKMLAAAMQRSSVKDSSLPLEEYITLYKGRVSKDVPTYSFAPNHVLFVNHLCPFADRARLACAMKLIDIPEVEIDLQNKPKWYPWVNYRETVPALLTPTGKYVHESQPVLHYLDDLYSNQGPKLVPREPHNAYAVRFAVSNTGHFTQSMYGIIINPKNEEVKKGLEWAAGELEKQLAEKRRGEGPFFGGTSMNAADLCLLPFLVRLKACTPELTDGYDLFSKFKLLEALRVAGMESEPGKKIFAALPVYCAVHKAMFRSTKKE